MKRKYITGSILILPGLILLYDIVMTIGLNGIISGLVVNTILIFIIACFISGVQLIWESLKELR